MDLNQWSPDYQSGALTNYATKPDGRYLLGGWSSLKGVIAKYTSKVVPPLGIEPRLSRLLDAVIRFALISMAITMMASFY